MSRDNSRLVWSDEQGGAVGNKPSKQKRKDSKPKKGGGMARGGFPNDGIVRVCREKSGRGGKTVTVLYGVPGSAADRKSLLKELKQRCGCGGSVQDAFLEIQGDQREVILTFLEEKGIPAKPAGG